MNPRPNAWLSQAENDLALARLACENGYSGTGHGRGGDPRPADL
jgi:hypothetical protein